MAMANLGVTYKEQKEWYKAAAVLFVVVPSSVRVLGKRDKYTIDRTTALASILLEMGKPEFGMPVLNVLRE